jgi:serine protease Do
MRVLASFRWGLVLCTLALPTAARAVPSDAPARRNLVVRVFERAKPSVVNIATTKVIEVTRGLGAHPLFDKFFDLPERRRRYKRHGVGSGFLIHRAGYVVTNAHVVARTAERQVVLADGSEHSARIVAKDPEHDLALLKIEVDHSLEPIELGRSRNLMVGERAIAIGNALGYEHTVTAGVISALGRSLEVSEDLRFEGLIQTDASINPGNSGGPLLNVRGELIGMNTAIRPKGQNIGFAIPVRQLRRRLPELLAVERRYELRTGLTVAPHEAGARVEERAPEGPAARAGLGEGDVITRFGGRPVEGPVDVHLALVERSAGETLTVKRAEGGATSLTLAKREALEPQVLLRRVLGLEAKPMTKRLQRSFGFEWRFGLVITGLVKGGPADAAGLRRGDVILRLGDRRSQSLEEAARPLRSVSEGERVPLQVLRVGRNTIRTAEVRLRAGARDE